MVASNFPYFATQTHGLDRLWKRLHRKRIHRSLVVSGRPRRGARVVVLRAVSYWLGWFGNFLSCSMTWSRL